MLRGGQRILFLILGFLSLFLGVIGIFLPLLPTTPFALLAAYFFSKSSHKIHRWLLDQKTLGPLIRDWESHGIIRLKAKWLATVMIVLLFSYSLLFVNVPHLIKGIVALSGIAILTFIWTRPHERKENLNNTKAK
ncbi:MAG: hypothetical protein CME63_08875 [Halobacteriovoraceae bacterium]|nr:hypothetical protein [Halobacteriovoraceae bacterium]MBC97850.1 hypothetical protein [Halobacteriovoraceae bacterium]|tara:strand:- start:36449 stop:36853 length:405 start_codon:yes stop_codon:yes gene_type:complete